MKHAAKTFTKQTTRGYWREAATMILTAPQRGASPNSGGSFEILMLKRGKESTFMPSTFVYPGGAISKEDFDNRWIDLYSRVTGEDFVHTVKDQFRISGLRTPIVSPGISGSPIENPDTDSISDTGIISREVGLRIAAIRETFEESGILIASPGSAFQLRDVDWNTERSLCCPSELAFPEGMDVKTWRQRVASDASAFLDLCTELSVVPNLWALREWSNWLTPTYLGKGKGSGVTRRFDTLFFLCCLDQHPGEADPDSEETILAQVKVWPEVLECIF